MFFERFREALSRYAEGVHDVGAPAGDAAIARAGERVGELPGELADLYRSWDGMTLFFDGVVLEPVDRIARAGERVRIGEAFGAPIEVDRAGRVYELDERGDAILCGTSLERWLQAVMAREGLLLDRDGEWRDVFAGDGLKPEARGRRVRAGLKADPGAAAWQLEAAELAFEEGRPDEAEAALARAVAADPGAGAAWALLGGIERRRGRPEEAARALTRAAEASPDPTLQLQRWSEAARAHAEAQDEPARAHAATRAFSIDPGAASRFLDDARRLDAEGDHDAARERAELAAALAPGGEAPSLAARLRARARLKPI